MQHEAVMSGREALWLLDMACFNMADRGILVKFREEREILDRLTVRPLGRITCVLVRYEQAHEDGAIGALYIARRVRASLEMNPHLVGSLLIWLKRLEAAHGPCHALVRQPNGEPDIVSLTPLLRPTPRPLSLD